MTLYHAKFESPPSPIHTYEKRKREKEIYAFQHERMGYKKHSEVVSDSALQICGFGFSFSPQGFHTLTHECLQGPSKKIGVGSEEKKGLLKVS